MSRASKEVSPFDKVAFCATEGFGPPDCDFRYLASSLYLKISLPSPHAHYCQAAKMGDCADFRVDSA